MAANIDVGRFLEAMEHTLQTGEDQIRCCFIIRTLERWQSDKDLDGPSRRRAAALLSRFEERYRTFPVPPPRRRWAMQAEPERLD